MKDDWDDWDELKNTINNPLVKLYGLRTPVGSNPLNDINTKLDNTDILRKYNIGDIIKIEYLYFTEEFDKILTKSTFNMLEYYSDGNIDFNKIPANYLRTNSVLTLKIQDYDKDHIFIELATGKPIHNPECDYMYITNIEEIRIMKT